MDGVERKIVDQAPVQGAVRVQRPSSIANWAEREAASRRIARMTRVRVRAGITEIGGWGYRTEKALITTASQILDPSIPIAFHTAATAVGSTQGQPDGD